VRVGSAWVYVAEQKEPVKRRVALKIIKLGMDNRPGRGAGSSERQALALLDHTSSPRCSTPAPPRWVGLLVMELVRGIRSLIL